MEFPNKMEVYRYRLVWKPLRNCTLPAGKFEDSDEFSAGVDREWKWRVRLYQTGIGDDPCLTHPSLALVMTSGCPVEVTSAVLCDETGGQGFMVANLSGHMFSSGGTEAIYTILRNQEFSLAYKKLFISCELIIGERRKSIPYCNSIPDYSSLSFQIGSLCFDDESKDFTLISSDQERFRVHKAVLMARSSYFYTMFFHTLDEPKLLEVSIESEVLKQVLHYMYSGSIMPKVAWTIELGRNLYIAADYYLINGLKERCLRFFVENLDRRNVVDHLIFANDYSNSKLRNACVRYFVQRVPPGSAEWKDFSVRCKNLVEEVRRLQVEEYILPI